MSSYGQISGAIGPQVFRERYAPRYKQSFASAMAVVIACVIITLVTWWLTRWAEEHEKTEEGHEVTEEGEGCCRCRGLAGVEGLPVLDYAVDRDLKGRAEV